MYLIYIPLHKNNETTDLTNFRPVDLPFFQRFLRKQLMSLFLTDFKVSYLIASTASGKENPPNQPHVVL